MRSNDIRLRSPVSRSYLWPKKCNPYPSTPTPQPETQPYHTTPGASNIARYSETNVWSMNAAMEGSTFDDCYDPTGSRFWTRHA